MRVVILATFLFSVPAFAQVDAETVENPASAEARALFARGSELANERRFSEAAEAFSRSAELLERPSTLFNLGLCHYALGRHGAALEVLERYVAIADASTEAPSIAEAQQMLTHSTRRVGVLVVDVLPTNSIVTLDGHVLDVREGSRRARVDPGTHVLRAEAEGHASQLVEIPVAPGDTVRRALTLESTHVETRLEVRAARPDAEIRVDGEVVGQGRAALEIDAGTHRVSVVHPELENFERTLELGLGDRFVLDVTPDVRVPERSSERPRWMHPVLWGVVGAVIVGAAVGVGTALAGREGSASGGNTGIVLIPGNQGSEGAIINP